MTTLICDLPHGGSGAGISTWMARGTGCLIAADLADQHPRKCGNQSLVIGTMTHEYLRLWRSGQIAAGARVAFVDSHCGEDPEDEWQDEAYRLFQNYSENESPNKFGPILWTEKHLEGPAVCAALGVTPFTAQIDLLAGTLDNCTLVDYKTARASGDSRYTTGTGRAQLVAYWMAAKAAGYNVTRIVIEQLTKTKTPKVNTYEMQLPRFDEQRRLKRFLQGAILRYQSGQRTVWLSQCDTCRFYADGQCIPSEK